MPAFAARHREKEGGGGFGGNNIRSSEATDLDRVPLEFTFEFH